MPPDEVAEAVGKLDEDESDNIGLIETQSPEAAISRIVKTGSLSSYRIVKTGSLSPYRKY